MGLKLSPKLGTGAAAAGCLGELCIPVVRFSALSANEFDYTALDLGCFCWQPQEHWGMPVSE